MSRVLCPPQAPPPAAPHFTEDDREAQRGEGSAQTQITNGSRTRTQVWLPGSPCWPLCRGHRPGWGVVTCLQLLRSVLTDPASPLHVVSPLPDPAVPGTAAPLTWKEGTSPSPGDTICHGAGRLALRENLYTAGWPLLFILETYTVPGESGRQARGGLHGHRAGLPRPSAAPSVPLADRACSVDRGCGVDVGTQQAGGLGRDGPRGGEELPQG